MTLSRLYKRKALNAKDDHTVFKVSENEGSPSPMESPMMVLQAWRLSTMQSHSVTFSHLVSLQKCSDLLQSQENNDNRLKTEHSTYSLLKYW